MKKNNLKLSVLSTAILLTLAGCVDSDPKPEPKVDSAPTASNVTVTGTGTAGDPYIVNATDNVDDADNDPTNELELPTSVNAGDMVYWDGANWITVDAGTTGQQLFFCHGAPSWGPCVALVSTISVGSISFDEAIVDAEVLDEGGASVTERGVCLSVLPNPTIADTILSNGTGLGAYSCTMSNLMPQTTYYVRAYAINSGGVAYGNELSFTTVQVTSLACNSCGIAGNNLTSPLMVGGHIEASVGQSISITQGKCNSTQYLNCTVSGFINPPQANVLSYSCTQGTGSGVTEVISFATPGVYVVTGRAGNDTFTRKQCTVYIIVE